MPAERLPPRRDGARWSVRISALGGFAITALLAVVTASLNRRRRR